MYRITFCCLVFLGLSALVGCEDAPPALPDFSNLMKPEARLTEAIQNKDLDGMRQALTAGVDPNKSEAGELPPLHQAALEGFKEGGELLLQHGANVNLQSVRMEKDERGRPSKRLGNAPLHTAVFSGQVEFAKMLIEHKADFNLRNGNEMTPLDMATSRLEWLKDAEQRVTTPEQIAANALSTTNNDAMIALLKEHGAQTTEDIEAKRLKKIEAEGVGILGTLSKKPKKRPPAPPKPTLDELPPLDPLFPEDPARP